MSRKKCTVLRVKKITLDKFRIVIGLHNGKRAAYVFVITILCYIMVSELRYGKRIPEIPRLGDLSNQGRIFMELSSMPFRADARRFAHYLLAIRLHTNKV